MPSTSSTGNNGEDGAAATAAVHEDEAMTTGVQYDEVPGPTQGSVLRPQDAPGSLHGAACQHYKYQLDDHAAVIIDVYTSGS
jgi:hypothetical protein